MRGEGEGVSGEGEGVSGEGFSIGFLSKSQSGLTHFISRPFVNNILPLSSPPPPPFFWVAVVQV